MKYCKLIFIVIIALFISACNNNDNEILNKAIDEFVDTLPYELDSDLVIPKDFNYNQKNYTVNFNSDNESIINSLGKVFRGFKDIETHLNFNLSKDDIKVEKEVQFLVAALSKDDIKSLIIDTTSINSKVTDDITLPTTLEYNGYVADLAWKSSNENAITNDGKVTIKTTVQSVILSVDFTFEDVKYTYSNLYYLEVQAISDEEFLNFTVKKFNLTDQTKTDIDLPLNLGGVLISWTSSHPNIISNDGLFNYPDIDTVVGLNAVFYYKGKMINKTYYITAQALTNEEKLNHVINTISFPKFVSTNLDLRTSFEYNVTGTWKSNNPDIITDNGVVAITNEHNEFSIILTLKSGEKTMEKEFILSTERLVQSNSHHHLDYVKDFDNEKFTNVVLEGDRLVLASDEIVGSYESPIFNSLSFTSLVGSWAAISSKTTTAELKVRVRVDGTWSNYLSYGSFGLGLQNKMFNQDGGVAQLIEDELKIKNSKIADAFQYQVVLQRDSVSVESAKLSLVSIALQIPSYTFNVDISSLPKTVSYDLPNLYQYEVPVIGGSICSITSSTMLLMYHGHTFKDSLPHRENAPLFKEYNTGIFGNWVFNTVGMGAFGENAYVKRIYSIEELFHHLATVGPVALSIKGNTGRYNTNGHLIVVSGYEITDSGRSILVHDPALPEVEYKYSETIFNGFTRNVIYVVENK